LHSRYVVQAITIEGGQLRDGIWHDVIGAGNQLT
jgi:hypothetical protein